MSNNAPIGMYDSGIGGLSVWREVVAELPAEDILYVADQAHAPYGERSREELFAFGRGMARFLRGEGAKAVVIACNSSSATVLNTVRRELPEIVFVGTANALQQAVEGCGAQQIGIIATEATLRGDFLTGKTMRIKRGQKIYRQPCPGLAARIEAGDVDSPELDAMLRGWLEPLLEKGIDGLVLGCTHYPFVAERIRAIVGPEVRLIDPAPVIARHIRYELAAAGLQAEEGEKTGESRFFTSGPDLERFRQRLELLGIRAAEVGRAEWDHTGESPLLRRLKPD